MGGEIWGVRVKISARSSGQPGSGISLERDTEMKSILKSFVIALPLLTAFVGGHAMAADGLFKQNLLSCGSDSKKFLSISGDQKVEIFQIIMSASMVTTVKVNLGQRTRLLQTFMDANDNFQSSLRGVEGNPGADIRVACSGIGEPSVTLVYELTDAS